MKYIIIFLVVITYTLIVYNATVYYHYDIKEHIIYGEVKPYELMNNSDLARVKLHYNGDNRIDSVTLSPVEIGFNMETFKFGNIHVDVNNKEAKFRDLGKVGKFDSYDQLFEFVLYPDAYKLE